MTEAEWLACTDPESMLEFLRGKVSERKLRLFGLACVRRVLHRTTWTLAVVEKNERYADEQESSQVKTAGPEFIAEVNETTEKFAWSAVFDPRGPVDFHIERGSQCGRLREIIGNPFRLANINRMWLAYNEGTIPKIAQAIYDERAFDRLPILADALEDAGCDNADLLRHCREPGEHVRGCWVVDLLLGKS